MSSAVNIDPKVLDDFPVYISDIQRRTHDNITEMLQKAGIIQQKIATEIVRRQRLVDELQERYDACCRSENSDCSELRRRLIHAKECLDNAKRARIRADEATELYRRQSSANILQLDSFATAGKKTLVKLKSNLNDYSAFSGLVSPSVLNASYLNANDSGSAPENIGIGVGILDAVPRNRRVAVYGYFANAPQNIKIIINENSKELKVEDTMSSDCCHYNMTDKTIKMEINLSMDEYAEVFSHEYGHFIDDKMRMPSERMDFRLAVAKDFALYDCSSIEGRIRFKNMLKNAFESGAAYDRCISDNLSSVFKNSFELKSKFKSEGVAFYHHDDLYWSQGYHRENEIFANSFSIFSSNTKESLDFMSTYFPNIYKAVNTILNGSN